MLYNYCKSILLSDSKIINLAFTGMMHKLWYTAYVVTYKYIQIIHILNSV